MYCNQIFPNYILWKSETFNNKGLNADQLQIKYNSIEPSKYKRDVDKVELNK